MKELFLLISLLITFSCSKNVYGTYNTNYSKNKSAFFQIKLNPDNTVEKTEIHIIGDFARGKYIVERERVICFLDSSKSKFPPDTLIFKIKGKKLYPIRKGVLNKNFYLKK